MHFLSGISDLFKDLLWFTLIWLKHFDLEIIYDYLYAINYKLYKIYTHTELHVLVEYTNPKSKNST